jgi:hypothetical protein
MGLSPGDAVPSGHKVTYWLVVVCKYLLQQKLSVGERLRISEMLDNQKDILPADEIAMLQPAAAAELEIFDVVRKADPPNKADPPECGCRLSFNMLANARTFDLLIAANPSVLAAIEYRTAIRAAAPQPEPADPPPPSVPTVMQRRSNGIQPTQHRSHVPPDQISRMGGGLPDWTFDNERDRQ